MSMKEKGIDTRKREGNNKDCNQNTQTIIKTTRVLKKAKTLTFYYSTTILKKAKTRKFYYSTTILLPLRKRSAL